MPKVISPSIEFNSKEKQGFFQLAKADAAEAIAHLTGRQLKLWLYLCMIDTYADYKKGGEEVFHPIPSPADIALKIGGSERRVVINIRILEQHGLYKTKVTGWQGFNASSANAKNAARKLKSGDRLGSFSDQLRSPNDQSRSPNDQLRSPNDQSRSPNDQLRSLNDRSRSPNDQLRSPVEAQTLTASSSKIPSDSSDSSDLNNTLSQELSQKKPTEGERENFNLNNQRSQNLEIEKINPDLSTIQESKSSKNFNPEKSNQIPPSSIDEFKRVQDDLAKEFNFSSTIRLPKTLAKLKEIGFPFDQYERFQSFVQNKAKKMPTQVQFLDRWALSIWDSLVTEYQQIEREREEIERAKIPPSEVESFVPEEEEEEKTMTSEEEEETKLSIQEMIKQVSEKLSIQELKPNENKDGDDQHGN